MSPRPAISLALLAGLLLASPAAAQPAEDARPQKAEDARPQKAEDARPRKAEDARPQKADDPRPAGRRRTRREIPGDSEHGLPSLESDPFQPPKGHRAARPESMPPKNRPWFVRPSLMFVARFSPNRSFLPEEGFGFGVQAGALLGTSSLRVSLSLNYHYYRVARTVEITVDSPQLTSCSEIRSISHHLATASAAAVAMFSNVTLWAGLRGGFAYGELNAPNDACGIEETNVPTGALGPELGFGYALKPDLFIGVNLAYLHFFSEEKFTDAAGVSHRLFYPLLTAGAHVMLRF